MEILFLRWVKLVLIFSLILMSCVSSRGGGGGGGLIIDSTDSTDVDPFEDFEAIDQDIQNVYPDGVEVYSSKGDLIGMLSLVKKIVKTPNSEAEPQEIYGIINSNKYLFYLNKNGGFSNISFSGYMMSTSLTDSKTTQQPFIIHKKIQYENRDRDYLIQYAKMFYDYHDQSNTDKIETISYIPLSLLDSKNNLYPLEGDIKYFMAYLYRTNDTFITCFDISGNVPPESSPSEKNLENSYFTDPYSFSNILENYSFTQRFTPEGSDFVLVGKPISENDQCLQDAFQQNAIPTYLGDLIVFKNKTDSSTISIDQINSFAKS